MAERVLITGGAGFIGSHTADALLALGYHVRALDAITAQVHPSGDRPGYLARDVELLRGDVRNIDDVRKALDGVDYVYHMAAETGVGQSMYQAGAYMDTNVRGTQCCGTPSPRNWAASGKSFFHPRALYMVKAGISVRFTEPSIRPGATRSGCASGTGPCAARSATNR